MEENLKEADILIGESSNISKDIAWLYDHGFMPISFDHENSNCVNAQLDYGYNLVNLYGFNRDFKIGEMDFNVIARYSQWSEGVEWRYWAGILPLSMAFDDKFDVVVMKEDGIKLDEVYNVDGITRVFETAFEKYGGERVEFGESSLVQFKKGTAEEAVRCAVACAMEIVKGLDTVKKSFLNEKISRVDLQTTKSGVL